MNFLKKIKNSIYGPGYYQEVTGKPLSYSLKYFFLLSVIVAFIYMFSFVFQAWPIFGTFAKTTESYISNTYPDNLVIKIEKGQVSTNMPEPILFPLPKGVNEKIENLIVIDTNTQPSPEEFDRYKTTVLITKDYLASRESSGKITLNPLKQISDLTVDKSELTSFLKKVKPWIAVAFPVITVFVLVFGYVFILLKLVYLFLAALLIWLVAKLKKTGLGYQKSYQMGVHLITFPLLFFSLPIPHINIPFLFTIVLLILAVINIKKPGNENLISSDSSASPQSNVTDSSEGTPPTSQN